MTITYDIDAVYQIGKSRANIPKIVFNRESYTFGVRVSTLKTNRKVVRKDITKDSFVFRAPEKAEAEEIKKIIKVQLNKLSASNIDNIVEKMKKLMINDNMTYFIISCIFNQAIQESMFCKLYIELFNKIAKQHKKILMKIIEEKKELINKTLIEMEDVESYDDFCDFLKNKKTLSGIYLFITEMYKAKLINKKILEGYLTTLFNNIKKNMDNDYRTIFIECINKILIDLNNKTTFKKYQKRIEKILTYVEENKKMREKFMVMDILEKYKK